MGIINFGNKPYCGIARMPTNQMRAVIVNCRHVANRGCSFHYIGLHPRHFAVHTAKKD